METFFTSKTVIGSPPLHVIQESGVVFFVDPAADTQDDDNVRRHEQVEPDCGDGGLDDYFSKVADEEVDRIEKEEVADHGTVVVYGIEDGGHVHQQLSEHRPEILDIPEKDEEGGEDEAHPDIKQDQAANWVHQQDEFPGEGDVVQDAEHEKHAEGQAEIDEGLDILGEQEKVLGDIHLGEDARIAHEGLHALAGGFAEAGKDQVPAKEVGGVMGGVSAEELGENQAHN